jgi:hypothetical protein
MNRLQAAEEKKNRAFLKEIHDGALAYEREQKARAARPDAVLGMTERQVATETNWGKPDRINRTTTASGIEDQWVFTRRGYLYFRDDILTAIQQQY